MQVTLLFTIFSLISFSASHLVGSQLNCSTVHRSPLYVVPNDRGLQDKKCLVDLDHHGRLVVSKEQDCKVVDPPIFHFEQCQQDEDDVKEVGCE
jgi:hypothetical protein